MSPEPTVKLGGKTLKKGTDYKVSYTNNRVPGTATCTITGTGDYTGKATGKFTIAKRDLSTVTLTLSQTEFTYTGGACRPAVTVNVGGIDLPASGNYTVSYKDNIQAGTAVCTITGSTNCTGSQSKTFTINKADLSSANVSLATSTYKFNGNAVEPVPRVSLNGRVLTFGKDFDTRKVAAGMKCYRNDSPALERELRKTFTDREFMKRIPVDMVLSGDIGKKLHLEVSEGFQNKAIAESETVLETSRNKDVDAANGLRELAQKELSALSGTAYRLGNLKVNIEGGAFIPGKLLRTLRQKAIEQLDNARCEWHELNPSATAGRALLNSVKFGTKVEGGNAARPFISVLVRRPEQIAALEGLDIDSIIMDFDWGVKYDKPLEQIRELGFKAGMATLRIHKPGESHYLKNILRLCPDFALVRNLGALAILRESGIPLAGDYSLNAANSLSYDWLLSQGLQTLHPSWDLNSTQLFDLLGDIDGSRLELTLHQYMPAFHSEYCAFARALTTGRRFPECGKICTQHKVEILDHKGERHFLQSDAECRNTLFVGKPQSALKLLPDLQKNAVSHFRLEMLQEDAETVRRKVSIYTQAIRGRISIDEATRMAGVEEKYGLSEGQLFNESVWHDRKKA